MPSRTASPRAARALLIARALIAAAAALAVTFVQDRSAGFALAVFGGFALATGLILFVDALAVRSRGGTRSTAVLAAIHLAAAAFCLLLPIAADARFHWVLVAWAVLAGAGELVAGVLGRRRGTADARDRITIGALTLVLAAVSLVVSPQYALEYVIEEAGREFTLTGTIVGVGLFGGWAAIVAVYLGIGAFSPAPQKTPLTKDAA
ncbi:acyl-CoA synthetase [Microbacterium karelineae]|uniref:acyl-CoA synthetase n=1 Tax=Microbacterium karelineae TaxID=2654283 RepID=UPI0012E9F6CB|nr:acyl-CoA synthetase [Microbacterium karelineae]